MIPSPPQGVWHLGPLPIRAYALCIIVGIVVAIYWGEKRWVARGGRPGVVLDTALWAVPFGLVGGRIYHVATDWYRYFGEGRNPLDALKIWDGGLGIWGAVALGALGAYLGLRQQGIRAIGAFGDAVAPGIVLAQGIGRLGNYFNQELYGRQTDVPWALEIYERYDEAYGYSETLGRSTGQVIATVHPTFLYELLWNVLVAVLLVLLDRRFRLGHGRVFAFYVALYCFGRFWVELLRADSATHVLGLRINTIVSTVVLLAALVYLWWERRGREEPAELRPASDPEG
ncbi:prolipoprotein diacylglyceryl transferase [Dietzia sp. 179-F 9C3 NHS]|uniref:prolipoprotein diacylglyceryl transferase n=1 Tax=Dietzia sp. 179-F 9C3 NHS TaxID=3374295 RepID=UPI0038797C63